MIKLSAVFAAVAVVVAYIISFLMSTDSKVTVLSAALLPLVQRFFYGHRLFDRCLRQKDKNQKLTRAYIGQDKKTKLTTGPFYRRCLYYYGRSSFNKE